MGQKYESDLSTKEKLEQQWRTICELKGKKKLEYLWTYYKFVLVILLAVVLVIHIAGVMIRGARENTVLSIVVVDAAQNTDDTTKQLGKELLELLGKEDKYDKAETMLSATSGDNYAEVVKLRTFLTTASGADMVICNEKVYKEYAAQGAFADVTTLIEGASGEDMTDGQIELSKYPDSFLSKYVEYEPAYVCVLEHSERKEAAVAVLQDVIKNK